ncbi:MAG: FtsX-like permease family protein [Acidobacteria bacterium]|nr:FtsX-like permease family protein [Acidobacteriota bacterium]
MNLQESFISALNNLAAHKLRSLLTMLGMIFGVGAVIAMLSIGAGAELQAMELIDRMGLRNVLVRDVELAEDELNEIRRNSLGVSLRDASVIRDGIPGVDLAVPRVEIDSYKIMSVDGRTAASVFGVSWHQQDLSDLNVADGRFIDRLDEEQHAQVAVIGAGVRRDLFGVESAIGRELKVNDVWFEVIGVLEDLGSGGQFQGVDIGTTATEIYIPVTTAIRKFDREPLRAPVDEIVVQLSADQSAQASAVAIRRLLDRIHGGEDDFELVVPEALLDQSRRTQRLFNVVMGCIAGISLLVGGIGITNIMLATVLERTREIGIRRAVGARRREIRNQFMIEAFAISLLGGLAGVVMGVVIARVVAASAGWETVVTASSVILSTSVSMAAGLVSGIYPATRASQLDPIEALRYE